jgi:outer membrane protein assembly factor BamB
VSVRAPLLSLAMVALLATTADAQSGLQITPDGKRTVVSKDVGGERWSIARSGASVSGNVYHPEGDDPQFVSCDELAREGSELSFACSGSDRCTSAPCPPSAWTALGEVSLPESFFEPSGGAPTAAAQDAARPAAEPAGGGMQVLPDRSATLVNRDRGSERWSIARFADDESVTGIVYIGDAEQVRFVWCEQLDVADGEIDLRCSGADSCRSGPCTPDQWTLIGEVTVPESFFAPPQSAAISPENAASLELAWDFPVASGVTAFPVVTDEFVYVGAWDGRLYALDPRTGDLRWSFDTGRQGLGIQATVTLLEGGDLLFGDSLTNVYRLDGRTGDLRWKRLVGNPAVDHIWSALSTAGGRIFVGLASHSDNPCTNGRTVALALDDGAELWTRENVPARVCRTDTAIACDDSSDCPQGGECVAGQGAGVTATPTTSASGDAIYVNSVGCYTYPSIGDSDSIMKLDAATGATTWINRVQPPEQFGFCAGDSSIDCGTDAMCNGAGPCQTKSVYHDFGFLNGPLLLEVDGETLVISGSKDGTLYALRESNGALAWRNVVVPTPVSPAFAGFGFFNGALAHENGLLFAAVNELIPSSNPEPPHLLAFDVRNGDIVWGDDIGAGYGNVAVQNGVLLTGTNAAPELYVYDAAAGRRLKTLPLPAAASSRPAIVGDTAYVAYGIISATGGIRAYRLPD